MFHVWFDISLLKFNKSSNVLTVNSDDDDENKLF